MVILLADDEPIVLKTLGQFLANCGHQVVVAEDGQEAILRLEERHDIGLVLSDVRMPEMDGLTLLQHARLRYPSIPVVLITGHGDMESAVAALRKGAHDFIRKPVKLDELMALVERVEQRHRLEAALVQERAKLVHAGRLATVGTMAAGIAHEINNPTTMIRANLQTFERLWERLGPVLRQHPAVAAEPDAAALLDELPGLTANMLSGTERIMHLVRQIKVYCHADESRPSRQVDLGRCLDDAIALTAQALRGIAVERTDAPAQVEGVDQELTQVFVNLLQNAAHALADQDSPRISIEVAPAAQGCVCVSVSDNGPGVPAALRDRIFDPFFTTKDPGQGIGLGLSICHGIVTEHRGSIAYQPAPCGGARFVVRLPLVASDPQGVAQAEPQGTR